jgi:hypothetical protein
MMRNSRKGESFVEKSRTKYGPFTRYEGGTGADPESNEAAGTKNFPSTFIPMTELEESPAAE